MKKAWILIILVAISTLLYGQAFSAGGGLSLGRLVLGLHRWGNANPDMVANTNYPSLSAGAFFDARYLLAEASLGYGWFDLLDGYIDGVYGIGGGAGRTYLWVEGSLMAKYPFPLGTITLFPLAGVEYRQSLLAQDASGADLDMKGTLDGLFLLGGLGVDSPLKGVSFVRSILVVGYKPYLEDIQTSMVDSLESSGYSATYASWFFRAGFLLGWRL